MKGRDLFQNIFVVKELVHGYGRMNVSPKCFLIVDIQKAYDLLIGLF